MNQNELNKIWNDILQKLSSSISSISFVLYFSHIQPFTVNGDTLVLLTQMNSHKKSITESFRTQLLEAIQKAKCPFQDFIVITKDEMDSYQALEPEKLPSSYALDDTMPFSKEYTFSSYVIGDSNRLAAMACQAIAEEPGEMYNPLFIYSHPGLGKTHLLNAIANYITEHSQKTKVIYVTAENFTNDYIYSIRNNKNADFIKNFNEKYRNTDVLMIDDVQFLEKAEKTQEALFHIFNDLYTKKKQIIISSDRPIRNLVLFDERLTSRFQSGFMVDIDYPSLEDRMAILQKKAEDYNFDVSNEVLYYLANVEKQNIRVLEGLLRTVGLYGRLIKKRIETVELAKEAIRDSVETTEERVTMKSITEATANYFNVKTDDLLGIRRTKNVVIPRQYAMYIITELLPDIPLASIGEFFSRDHSTVINARDKIGRMKEEDASVKTAIEDVKNMIFNK